MRRTAFLRASQILNLATTAFVPTTNTEGYKNGVNSLFFADRAVKMTNVNIAGSSFTCTPTVLTCKHLSAAAAVRLVSDKADCVPMARVLVFGNCSVSLLRSRRVVFHCTGDVNREQRHELALKRGDVLTVLSGCDLLRDWTSVERTWLSVANEDLEYIAEEMLLELSTSARTTTATGNDMHASDDGNSAVSDHNASNRKPVNSGTCIMATVWDKPLAVVPQPPTSMHFSAH